MATITNAAVVVEYVHRRTKKTLIVRQYKSNGRESFHSFVEND